VTKVFVYTTTDFHDLRHDLVNKAIDDVSTIKTIDEFINYLTTMSKKKTNFKTPGRISWIRTRLLTLFKELRPTQVYSFGKSYADLICCKLCAKLGIPFILLSEEDFLVRLDKIPNNKLLGKSLIMDMVRHAQTTICFSEELNSRNYKEISQECTDFIKRVCDTTIVITPSDEKPSDILKFAPEPSDNLSPTVFIIKTP
tara:strand:- start:495 stop:1091 length:597 start_codon:yes stop_codon:yes gene_type:complete